MNNVNIYQFYEDNYVSLQDYNQLQSNWNSLKEDLEWVINDYNGDIDIETRNIDSEFLRGMSWEAQELLNEMNKLESGGKD